MQALNQISTITCLDLNNNNISGIAADQLAATLLKSSSLEDLRLRNNSLKPNEMAVLIQSLRHLTSLRSINFSGNQLNEEVAPSLSTLIINNPTIKELYLGNNNLQAGMVKIVMALKSLAPFLKLLDVSNNSIPQQALKELAYFVSNSKLEKLYLSYSNFNSSLNVSLEALSKLHTLTTLYLDGCNLPDTASDKVAVILNNNSSLQELQLRITTSSQLG